MKYYKKMTGSHIYLSPVTADERGRMLTVHADKLYMGIMENQFKD